jgi:hypothetical protein
MEAFNVEKISLIQLKQKTKPYANIRRIKLKKPEMFPS